MACFWATSLEKIFGGVAALISFGLQWDGCSSLPYRGVCHKVVPRGSKNPEQYLTKEQQKACLEMAAAELIREITQGRSLN